jgi:iron(III) transport system substrate-binding protein
MTGAGRRASGVAGRPSPRGARARRRPTPRAAAVALLVLVAALVELACTSDGRTPVVVYSPHGTAMLTDFEERFEAAHPQYDLQFLDLASQAVLDRLRAERANPQCDLWWGASAVTFAQAADEGLLEPHSPSWAATIPAEARDPQARWFGLYETPEVIVYNNAVLGEADAPRDWDDLLDPRWRGQILLRAPFESDTMRTIFGAIILKEWPKTDSPEAGYDWLRRLAANTKDYSPTWDAVLTSLNRREATLSVWNMPDVKRVVDERGYTLATRVPASGSPIVTDGIAVVKGAPHPQGAHALYEFVGTHESLIHAAEKFYRIPIRNDIERARLPGWIAEAAVERMSMDWERFRSGIRDWMTFWSAEIRGAAGK